MASKNIPGLSGEMLRNNIKAEGSSKKKKKKAKKLTETKEASPSKSAQQENLKRRSEESPPDQQSTKRTTLLNANVAPKSAIVLRVQKPEKAEYLDEENNHKQISDTRSDQPLEESTHKSLSTTDSSTVNVGKEKQNRKSVEEQTFLSEVNVLLPYDKNQTTLTKKPRGRGKPINNSEVAGPSRDGAHEVVVGASGGADSTLFKSPDRKPRKSQPQPKQENHEVSKSPQQSEAKWWDDDFEAHVEQLSSDEEGRKRGNQGHPFHEVRGRNQNMWRGGRGGQRREYHDQGYGRGRQNWDNRQRDGGNANYPRGGRGRGHEHRPARPRRYNELPEFIEEIKGDLFTCKEEVSLCHCVSADLAMGKGIAVEFRDRFKRVEELKRQEKTVGEVAYLKCVKNRYVYYLITKMSYYKKPTLSTMKNSLIALRTLTEEHKITELAMPRIGSGLDRLDWDDVLDLIIAVFKETNIKITVYTYDPKKNK